MPRSVLLTFKVPPELVEKLDELVSRGIFNSRSEALRRALALLLREYEAGSVEVQQKDGRGREEGVAGVEEDTKDPQP